MWLGGGGGGGECARIYLRDCASICKLVAQQCAQVHRPLTSGAVCGDASSIAHHPLLHYLRTGCAGERSLVLFP